MTTLTRQQHRALIFINRFAGKKGYAPTLAQIAAGVGLKTRSAGHRIVGGLAAANMVRLVGGPRRKIEIISRVATPADLQRLSDDDLSTLAERVGAEMDRRGEP